MTTRTDTEPRLREGDTVALMRAHSAGLSPDDHDVLLPRGQVGVVVESRDPAVVVVEFADLDSRVFAIASVPVVDLLRLLRKDKLGLAAALTEMPDVGSDEDFQR